MLLQTVMPTVLNLSKSAASFATKNSTALLTGVALTTLVGTALSVASAVPKVIKVEEEKEKDLEIARNDKEISQIKRAARLKVAKIIIVPVFLFCLCAGSIITNSYLASKKIAALAAAYAISEQKIEDLENAAKEIAGPKKSGLIEAKAAEKDIERRASRNEEDVICTGHGDDLFWEPKTGHWLRANQDFIRLAFERIDNLVNNGSMGIRTGSDNKPDDYRKAEIKLNDLFDMLKLPQDTELGNWFGWLPGDVIGCNLVNTGKHYWDNGNSEYYTVIDYQTVFLGKTGHRV